MRMVVGDGMRLTIVGVVLGLAVSAAAMRLIRAQLYGVAATDPVVCLAVPAILLATALLAAFVPARRAGRVSPVRVLRAD